MADVTNNMVHGVQPVLQTLRRIEPELYKLVVKDLKDKAEPLRARVAQGFPDEPWTSTNPVQWTLYGRTTNKRNKNGTGAKFPRYNASKARRGVTVRVGGKKVRRTNSYPIMRVVQSNAGGQVYDLSKENKKSGRESFVDNLNKSGEPSRVMWKRVRQFMPLVENDIEKAIDKIMDRFSVEIAHETDRRNQASLRASKQARNVLGQFRKAVR
jgi:hypothetical protein